MSELAEWLLERIGEDEDVVKREEYEVQRGAIGDPVRLSLSLVAKVSEARGPHAQDWHRRMTESRTKRRIVETHRQFPHTDHADVQGCSVCGHLTLRDPTNRAGIPAPAPCQTLRLLALPYADRPGYDEAWRP